MTSEAPVAANPDLAGLGIDNKLLQKFVEKWEASAHTSRAAMRRYARQSVRADDVEFQAVGMTVMAMIDKHSQ
ncbi:hypothetical protein ACCS79_03665 [Rhizobium johnstonii]|uniref:hypothetical protein n=1 Tax=Rhizobium johnstonii TaxID=3019933 RepID=UPI003F9B4F67